MPGIGDTITWRYYGASQGSIGKINGVLVDQYTGETYYRVQKNLGSKNHVYVYPADMARADAPTPPRRTRKARRGDLAPD